MRSAFASTLYSLCFLTVGSQIACKDNGMSSELDSRYGLCYVKLINDSWQVVAFDEASGQLTNISNNSGEGDNPAYSPDGNQIAFTYHNSVGGTDIYLFRRMDNTLTNATPGSEYSAENPQWLSDKEILFDYHKLGENSKMFLLDLETGNIKKLLDFPAKMYFCADRDEFVYQPEGTDDYRIVYRSSLSGAQREILLDLSSIGGEYTSSFDFDPIQRKLLLLIAQTPRITNVLAEFDLRTRLVSIVSKADSGWIYLKPAYSSDYSRMACVTRNYDSQSSSVMLFDKKGGDRTELVVLRSEQAWLSLYDNVFSPDNRYLVYSKNVQQGGDQFHWISELFVYDFATRRNIFVDSGISPTWKP